ncbi:hypothetical protein [Aeromonas phage ZPAH34]|uniref:hypothetical protein n=1 Tax=Aeromonas phage ZPAH34 TaxID=2924888 RepID=UPI00232983C4|nr:hypothetical protein PQD16_gp196 [Aeromonas phage ZPAH34]UOX39487.1 hypothetical protein [Aeromonas phage ZPAH34]
MRDLLFKQSSPDTEKPTDTTPVFYDPVQFLVNAIATEISIESKNQSGGFQFWAQINTHFFETSIASFNESLETLKTALGQNKELYDYAARFLIRIKSNPFANDAIKTTMISFSELDDALDLKTLVIDLDNQSNSFAKLILFIAINKPQLSLLIIDNVLNKGD